MAVDSKLGFQGRPSQDFYNRYLHGNPNADPIRFGIVLQVNVDGSGGRIPGTVDVACNDGSREINVQVLTDPVDPQSDAGEFNSSYTGAQCCLITTAGGTVYAVGFVRPHTSGFASEGEDAFTVPRSNVTRGDWLRTAPTGARIMLTRGGLIELTSTPACRVLLNPRTGEVSINGLIQTASADGYSVRRGRLPGNDVSPDRRTRSTEVFLDQANAELATSVAVEHGSLDGAVRRITVAGPDGPKGQETYSTGGEWIGDMPKYQFGAGADEPFVLGSQLLDLLGEMFDFLVKHTHLTAFGPTLPTTEAPELVAIRAKYLETRRILSKFCFSKRT